jgi:hypothetical protein
LRFVWESERIETPPQESERIETLPQFFIYLSSLNDLKNEIKFVGKGKLHGGMFSKELQAIGKNQLLS